MLHGSIYRHRIGAVFAALIAALMIGILSAGNAFAASKMSIPEDAVIHDGNHYKAFHESMTWAEAKAYCKSLGGHLAVITSSEEQAAMSKLGLKRSYNYWLGASDSEEEGAWEWITQEAWSYENWGSGQPDNTQKDGSEADYLMLCASQEKHWYDVAGTPAEGFQYGFICEWETDVSGAVAELSTKTYTYSGSEKKPTVTVALNGKTLTEGKDFSVSYTDNVNAGKAKVIISGMGNYAGEKELTFTIKPKSLSDAVVTTGKPSYECDGAAKKPGLTVTLGKAKLTKSTDYSIKYSNNTAPGTATVTVTGKGNYTGTATGTFTITLKKPEVTLKSTRNGEITATLTEVPGAAGYRYEWHKEGVKTLTRQKSETGELAINDLVPGTVYYVRARAYAKTASGSTIWGPLGEYKKIQVYRGTKSLKNAVVKLADPDAVWSYTGEGITPKVVVTRGTATLKFTRDYTVTYKNNVNAGTATITVTGAGKYCDSVSTTFKISRVKISKADVQMKYSWVTYAFKALKPAVIAEFGDKTLASGTDFTVTYQNNTDVGTATAIITGKGNFTGTIKRTFTIKPRDVNDCTVNLKGKNAFFYNGKTKKPSVTVCFRDMELSAGDLTFHVEYENNRKPGNAAVKVIGTGNMTGTKTVYFKIFKVYAQQDERWRDIPYGYTDEEETVQAYIGKGGSRDVGAGCGILSFTNALWYLKGLNSDPTEFVEILTDFSLRRGYRLNGSGTVEGLVKAFCDGHGSEYGITHVKDAQTLKSVRQDLIDGKVAVVHLVGHYVAVVNYDPATEQYLVLDSSMWEERGTIPDGYRWMTGDEFVFSMTLYTTKRRVQVFGLAE